MSYNQRKSYREFQTPTMDKIRGGMPAKANPDDDEFSGMDPEQAAEARMQRAGLSAEQIAKEKVRRAAVQSLVYFDAGSPDALPEDNVFRPKAMEHLRGDHFKNPQFSACPICLRKKQRDAARSERYAAAGFTRDGRRLEDGTAITPSKNHRAGERFS